MPENTKWKFYILFYPTKSQAQTIVTNIVEAEQATWDDLSDDAKALTSGRPGDITLP